MKIIFLDIDGVLNDRQYNKVSEFFPIFPEKIELLNKVLEKTDAYIVISSSWRYLVHNGSMTLEGLEFLLRSHGLKNGRMIGVTPKSSPADECDNRQVAIQEWLDFHRRDKYVHIENYCIVDDLSSASFSKMKNFIRTDGDVGLTEADCAKIVELL